MRRTKYKIRVFDTRAQYMGSSLSIYIPASAKIPNCDYLCCHVSGRQLIYECLKDVCVDAKVRLRKQHVKDNEYYWLTIPSTYARMLGVKEHTPLRVFLYDYAIVVEVISEDEMS